MKSTFQESQKWLQLLVDGDVDALQTLALSLYRSPKSET